MVFQNFGMPWTLGKDTFYSSKIHEITLNPDKTYEFWSRQHISCFTWHQYKGVWERQGDTLFFSDKYEVDENDVRVIYQKDLRQYFTIKFKTDRHSELNNKSIKVQYVYDYDAHIDDVEKVFTINPDNSIQILFNDIPDFNQLSGIKIVYQINSTEKRYDFLTQNNPVNSKKSDIPNVISVEFVERPKKEMVYRVVKAVITGDTLQILSVSKTKTTLPDYNLEIEFENNYVLMK